MTDLSKSQLNQILSALDGCPRNPNTKSAALKAIGRHADTLSISIDDLIASADGLLDGRVDTKQFRDGLRHQPSDIATGQVPAREAKRQRSRDGTKQATIIAMLRRPEGATIKQMMHETGWLAHTCRGLLAGALKKKLGLTITSEKVDGSERIYRITGSLTRHAP